MILRRPIRRLAVIALALFVAGCWGRRVGDNSVPPDAKVTHWDCGQGRVLTVAWERRWAHVSFEGGTWRLPLAISASGARYASDEAEVWEHQGEVRWTEAGKAGLTCPEIRGK